MCAEIPWLLEELMPHAHPMILIDQLRSLDEGYFTTTVRIAEDCPFFEPSCGVPTYVGIEYIAQTVCAVIGLQARQAGDAVQPGYLLGTRKFETTMPYFVLGSMLTVQVMEEFESTELGKYAGEISDVSGATIVKTSITVYSGPAVQPQWSAVETNR